MNELTIKPCANCNNPKPFTDSHSLPGASQAHLIYIECACGMRTRGTYYRGDFNWGYAQAIENEIKIWNKRNGED